MNIQERRRLADLLQQQSMQPLQGQMVSGHYVGPSYTQGLSQLANAYFGGKMRYNADQEEAAQQQQRAEEMQKLVQAMQGGTLGQNQYQTPEVQDLATQYAMQNQLATTKTGNQGRKFIGTPSRVEKDGKDYLVGMVQDPNSPSGFRIESQPVGGEFADIQGQTAGQEANLKVLTGRRIQQEKDAQQASTNAFNDIGRVRTNISNYDEAIAALDSGARSGAIESIFPTIRASSVRLQNAQNRLGLDVIGDVTFGALSKGELDLALTTAIPTGLDEPELRKWLVKRKNAQEIYLDYLENAALFLAKPGNTLDQWIERNKGSDYGKPTTDTSQSIEDLVNKYAD